MGWKKQLKQKKGGHNAEDQAWPWEPIEQRQPRIPLGRIARHIHWLAGWQVMPRFVPYAQCAYVVPLSGRDWMRYL